MKKLVLLFDMDGTIIDSTEAITESFETAFRSLGKDIGDVSKVLPLIGYPLDEIFVKLGIKKENTDDFINAYKAHYRIIAKRKTKLISGAKEAVREAYGFARLGIVTTKTSLYTKKILEYFGILRQFEVVIGREDTTHTKPHPEPILKALRTMDADKRNAWMIGDTILDMGAGKAADIECAGVLCGYGKEKDLAQYTNIVLKDTLEAVQYIKNKEFLNIGKTRNISE
ncbi:MAG: HAD family hydrolase [Campylobacteraceae bacterium]|jgi:phosphoglycolate phosphatase|nr:HAD family hydrolase [Campylobacteraceae bacterium]